MACYFVRLFLLRQEACIGDLHQWRMAWNPGDHVPRMSDRKHHVAPAPDEHHRRLNICLQLVDDLKAPNYRKGKDYSAAVRAFFLACAAVAAAAML